jgi:hypothetical protein
VQIITAAPRSALTEAQVLYLIEGSSDITYGCGANLLDLALTQTGTLDLLSGSVRRSNLANIHGTCDLEIDVELPWGSTLVQPWMDLSSGGITARFYCGVYSLATPEATYGMEPRRRRVQGYDRLYLLTREIGYTWVAPSGAGVLAEVRRAITAAGLTGVEFDGTSESVTLPQAMIWPLVNNVAPGTPVYDQTRREQETGVENATTWLRVINDLLFSIGYRGLYADPATGVYRSSPYVAPENRGEEHVFNFDDPLKSIVVPDRTLTEDGWKAPNKWVFVRTNMPGTPPATPVETAGVYTVDRSASDPRGLVWPQQIPLDVASQAALVAQGDNRVASDLRTTSIITVTTAPFPLAGHQDVYRYTDALMGKNAKVQEREFVLDLFGADMTHTWEVIS